MASLFLTIFAGAKLGASEADPRICARLFTDHVVTQEKQLHDLKLLPILLKDRVEARVVVRIDLTKTADFAFANLGLPPHPAAKIPGSFTLLRSNTVFAIVAGQAEAVVTQAMALGLMYGDRNVRFQILESTGPQREASWTLGKQTFALRGFESGEVLDHLETLDDKSATLYDVDLLTANFAVPNEQVASLSEEALHAIGITVVDKFNRLQFKNRSIACHRGTYVIFSEQAFQRLKHVKDVLTRSTSIASPELTAALDQCVGPMCGAPAPIPPMLAAPSEPIAEALAVIAPAAAPVVAPPTTPEVAAPVSAPPANALAVETPVAAPVEVKYEIPADERWIEELGEKAKARDILAAAKAWHVRRDEAGLVKDDEKLNAPSSKGFAKKIFTQLWDHVLSEWQMPEDFGFFDSTGNSAWNGNSAKAAKDIETAWEEFFDTWLQHHEENEKAIEEKARAAAIGPALAEATAAQAAADREREETERAREEERVAAEARRLEQERVAAEERRLEEERAAEALRVEQERAAAEERRLEEERAAEARRVEQERAAAEERRLEEERAAEARRVEQERVAAEERRLEEERAAEARRVEQERVAAEERAEEARRLESEQAAAEAERMAARETEERAEADVKASQADGADVFDTPASLIDADEFAAHFESRLADAETEAETLVDLEDPIVSIAVQRRVVEFIEQTLHLQDLKTDDFKDAMISIFRAVTSEVPYEKYKLALHGLTELSWDHVRKLPVVTAAAHDPQLQEDLLHAWASFNRLLELPDPGPKLTGAQVNETIRHFGYLLMAVDERVIKLPRNKIAIEIPLETKKDVPASWGLTDKRFKEMIDNWHGYVFTGPEAIRGNTWTILFSPHKRPKMSSEGQAFLASIDGNKVMRLDESENASKRFFSLVNQASQLRDIEVPVGFQIRDQRNVTILFHAWKQVQFQFLRGLTPSDVVGILRRAKFHGARTNTDAAVKVEDPLTNQVWELTVDAKERGRYVLKNIYPVRR